MAGTRTGTGAAATKNGEAGKRSRGWPGALASCPAVSGGRIRMAPLVRGISVQMRHGEGFRREGCSRQGRSRSAGLEVLVAHQLRSLRSPDFGGGSPGRWSRDGTWGSGHADARKRSTRHHDSVETENEISAGTRTVCLLRPGGRATSRRPVATGRLRQACTGHGFSSLRAELHTETPLPDHRWHGAWDKCPGCWHEAC